jgi:BCD family chlorophyll transporter-like MFS transporter
MRPNATSVAMAWRAFGLRLLPFADSATRELPLGRLLRLSLFQVSCGMAAVLLTGTLNRVMIVELNVPGWLVGLMVSLPLVFAPLRALIGFRSDHHRSALGWRRGPYIWFGSMMQFGGLAIMPFSLLILSGDTHGPIAVGYVGAALAFLLVGAGLHTTQTAGLALATDLADGETQPRVVALLYVMLLVGMMLSALLIGALLADFSAVRLIQVVQGAAVVTMVLNATAMWKQEVRRPSAPDAPRAPTPAFRDRWQAFISGGRSSRLLVAVGLCAAAFSMQDVLLEPYGGEILGLPVAATTALTALWAAGSLAGFGVAARQLGRQANPYRLAGFGALIGIAGLSAIVFAAPLKSAGLFAGGVGVLGFGGALASVGTLIAAMTLSAEAGAGLALGAWGAVQATCAGLAIAFAGAARDVVSRLATEGRLGAGITDAAAGYQVVYHIEIGLLFAFLVAIGPLVRDAWTGRGAAAPARFGIAQFPI